MTSNEFLDLKIPLKPYISYSRGPSTSYNESFHIKNTSNGKMLNIFLCKMRGVVSASGYDHKKPLRQRDTLLVNNTPNFEMTDDLFDYLNKP